MKLFWNGFAVGMLVCDVVWLTVAAWCRRCGYW